MATLDLRVKIHKTCLIKQQISMIMIGSRTWLFDSAAWDHFFWRPERSVHGFKYTPLVREGGKFPRLASSNSPIPRLLLVRLSAFKGVFKRFSHRVVGFRALGFGMHLTIKEYMAPVYLEAKVTSAQGETPKRVRITRQVCCWFQGMRIWDWMVILLHSRVESNASNFAWSNA